MEQEGWKHSCITIFGSSGYRVVDFTCWFYVDAGFDQLLVFRNPIVFEKANILDIYVMDIGISQGRFGYATAVGLFKV